MSNLMKSTISFFQMLKRMVSPSLMEGCGKRMVRASSVTMYGILLVPMNFFMTLHSLNLASSSFSYTSMNLPLVSQSKRQFSPVFSIPTTSISPTGQEGSLRCLPSTVILPSLSFRIIVTSRALNAYFSRFLLFIICISYIIYIGVGNISFY